MDPTLSSLLASSLQWIFVGGKGGVGKTTTSCSLATAMAHTPITISGKQRDRKVLIISTDPAHNLSDAFDQKFTKAPTPVVGVPNLHGMEIDASAVASGTYFDDLAQGNSNAEQRDGLQAAFKILRHAANTLPGVDEVAVFTEIMKEVKRMNYDVVVFDTAPTGHTLRLLALPHTLSTTIDSILGVKGLATLISSAAQLITSATGQETQQLSSMLEKWRDQVKEVQLQFADNTKTAFVCVCIPEFLSVYETERLIQELMKYNINCEHVVVNQLVVKGSREPPCRMCESRKKIQGKYLAQIHELYEDFHVVQMPLHGDEVRGVEALKKFSRFLLHPYCLEEHGFL